MLMQPSINTDRESFTHHLPLLECAFSVRATVAQAALFTGCSPSLIQHHINEKTALPLSVALSTSDREKRQNLMFAAVRDFCHQKAQNIKAMPVPVQEILTPKQDFLRGGKKRTKPSIIENPQIMQRLEFAFSIGGTYAEAAGYAGCSLSTIKHHVQSKTPIGTYSDGTIKTFDEWVELCRALMPLMAKLKIFSSLDLPLSKTGSKDAWKILERLEPEEWGGWCRACYKKAERLYP